MTAIDDIAAERRRQIEVEKWTPEHDDLHIDGTLAKAAACYANPVYCDPSSQSPEHWPWEHAWWKPTTRRRNLVKAAALIVAEIERLDRKGAADFLKRPHPALRGKLYEAPLRGRR